MEQQGERHRKDDVRHGPGKRYDDLVPFGVLEVAQVHGYGLGEGEYGTAEHDHDERQQHGAEGIDMREGVERDAPP